LPDFDHASMILPAIRPAAAGLASRLRARSISSIRPDSAGFPDPHGLAAIPAAGWERSRASKAATRRIMPAFYNQSDGMEIIPAQPPAASGAAQVSSTLPHNAAQARGPCEHP